MQDEQQNFIDAIRAAHLRYIDGRTLDEKADLAANKAALHLAYADWLDEQDNAESAEYERKEAKTWHGYETHLRFDPNAQR